MKQTPEKDPFLEERLARYGRWMQEGKISFSSKVVPVNESLDARQWVLPTEPAIEILGNARLMALQPCECRTHYNRCDNPIEVCFLLNEVGAKAISQSRARPVDLTEAEKILKKANAHGLVHLSLYMPDHQVYALCSCCTCCCHDLQLLKTGIGKGLTVRSDYWAETKGKDCIDCGECARRCVFGARNMKDEALQFDPAECLGCGLCVTTCPVDAITMRRHTASPIRS